MRGVQFEEVESRSLAGSVRRSSIASAIVKVGAITCVGRPSTIAKMVRKDSWRLTTSLRLCSSAAWFRRPLRRMAAGIL